MVPYTYEINIDKDNHTAPSAVISNHHQAFAGTNQQDFPDFSRFRASDFAQAAALYSLALEKVRLKRGFRQSQGEMGFVEKNQGFSQNQGIQAKMKWIAKNCQQNQESVGGHFPSSSSFDIHPVLLMLKVPFYLFTILKLTCERDRPHLYMGYEPHRFKAQYFLVMI